MKKYLYYLCICAFGAVVLFQADETLGMRGGNQSHSSQQRGATRSRDDSDIDYRSSKSGRPDHHGLKSKCKCVNDIIDEFEHRGLMNNRNKEAFEAVIRMHDKSGHGSNDRQERFDRRSRERREDYDGIHSSSSAPPRGHTDSREHDKDRRHDSHSSRGHNTTSSSRERSYIGHDDHHHEDWRRREGGGHVSATNAISSILQKYKMAPQLDAAGVNLAENSASVHNISDENDEKKSAEENKNQSTSGNRRINQRDFVKLRQELEKHKSYA